MSLSAVCPEKLSWDRFKVSSEILEKPGIEHMTPGLQGAWLTTTRYKEASIIGVMVPYFDGHVNLIRPRSVTCFHGPMILPFS